MSKHTPGPWRWGDDYMGLYGAGPDNDVLSTAYYENMWLSHKSDEAEREANARLIAAAPELIAACIEARVWLLGHESAERQIALLDAAIAKATGEQA